MAPEPRGRRAVAICEHQAYAGDQKERRQDQRPCVEPERIAIEVPLRQADMTQVETEVIDNHGQDREAAQCVECADACRWCRTGDQLGGRVACFPASFPPAAHVSEARFAIARAPRRRRPAFQARQVPEPRRAVSTAVATASR